MYQTSSSIPLSSVPLPNFEAWVPGQYPILYIHLTPISLNRAHTLFLFVHTSLYIAFLAFLYTPRASACRRFLLKEIRLIFAHTRSLRLASMMHITSAAGKRRRGSV